MICLFFTFLLTALGSIQDCNTSSVFQITKLDLVPSSPTPGEPLAMTVQFNNPGLPITDGVVTTTLSYNFIPFSPTTEALCTNTVCPLVTGFNDRSTTNPWPDVSGTIVSTINWMLDEINLLCIKISVKTSNSLRGNTTIPGQLELLNVFRGNGMFEDYDYDHDMCPLQVFPSNFSKALVISDRINKQLVVYKPKRRHSSKLPEV